MPSDTDDSESPLGKQTPQTATRRVEKQPPETTCLEPETNTRPNEIFSFTFSPHSFPHVAHVGSVASVGSQYVVEIIIERTSLKENFFLLKGYLSPELVPFETCIDGEMCATRPGESFQRFSHGLCQLDQGLRKKR